MLRVTVDEKIDTTLVSFRGAQKADFVTDGWSQATCFPLFPVFVLN